MATSSTTSSVVFSRYAGALVDLASNSKEFKKVSADIDVIDQLFADSSDFASFAASRTLSRKEQEAAVEAIAKKFKFQKLTKNFLGVLIDNRRLDALGGIATEYKAEVSRRSGEVKVRVETAAKLTAAQAKEVQKKISKAIGNDVVVDAVVTPEILGGMVVTIGSYMIDDSVRRKVERLGFALKQGSNENTVQNLKEVI